MKDSDLETLINSNEQLRKVGINLSQVVRLLHSNKAGPNAIPLKGIIKAIKAVSNDIKIIKEKYISKD